MNHLFSVQSLLRLIMQNFFYVILYVMPDINIGQTLVKVFTVKLSLSMKYFK